MFVETVSIRTSSFGPSQGRPLAGTRRVKCKQASRSFWPNAVDRLTESVSQIQDAAAAVSPESTGSPALNPVNAHDEGDCVICMSPMTNPVSLPCHHKFCRECIGQFFDKCQPRCPSCGRLHGAPRGNQPAGGTMTHGVINQSLPGHPNCCTIVIEYNIPGGIQTKDHPNPGVPFSGTHRQAFLPDTVEGRQVLDLLQKAFSAGLVFTVGRSATTGIDNTVIWNDIHHKTSFTGPYGYPDPTYLTRIKHELAAKGIS